MSDSAPLAISTETRLGRYLGRAPDISSALFVASCARIIGDVRLGRDSSVFYGAVLRADIASIRVGEESNVQDGCIIHLADDLDTVVGDRCTIGHAAILHGCRVGNTTLVGMRATILDGAEIGEECLVGAGALVTQRMVVPARSLVLDSPAKVVRPLTAREIESLHESAAKYRIVARAHAERQAR